MAEIGQESKNPLLYLQFINHNNSDAKYNKSVECSDEEFTQNNKFLP